MGRRKGKSGPGTVQVRSWKSIQQKVSRPAGVPRRSRTRNFLFVAGAVFLSVVMIFGTYFLLFETDRLLGGGTTYPMKTLAFETDGTLSQEWIEERMALPEDTTLLQADIFRLREIIEAHPQVETCVIRKRFPDVLEVRLVERKPVLRVMVREAGGRREAFVARDGTIFPGIGLDRSSVRMMPFLTGVTLSEKAEGFVPVAGFRTVADLVGTASKAYPDLFRTWRIVDLSLYDPVPGAAFSAIRVRGTGFEEALFGTEDHAAQLSRLQDIVDGTQAAGVEKLGRIDLRFGDSVPTVIRRGEGA